MFTEFVLTWKNAMLKLKQDTQLYIHRTTNVYKMCRKKRFDVLVIMNVFRESTEERGKKSGSWQGDCLWDRDGPWGREGGHSPSIPHNKQCMNGHEILKHSEQVPAHLGPISPLISCSSTSFHPAPQRQSDFPKHKSSQLIPMP